MLFITVAYDCSDSPNPQDGTFLLTDFNGGTFQTACDSDGWTVIQSRGQFGNPQDYFFRNYAEYEKGFGEPGKEHWLGLKNIHALTSGRQYSLKVQLWGADETYKEAHYE